MALTTINLTRQQLDDLECSAIEVARADKEWRRSIIEDGDGGIESLINLIKGDIARKLITHQITCEPGQLPAVVFMLADVPILELRLK